MTLAPLLSASPAIQLHKATMISMFFGALIVAGIFTFMPGRIMYDVLFGG